MHYNTIYKWCKLRDHYVPEHYFMLTWNLIMEIKLIPELAQQEQKGSLLTASLFSKIGNIA